MGAGQIVHLPEKKKWRKVNDENHGFYTKEKKKGIK